MAKAKKTATKKSSGGGRGSAEAIEKRRVARQLNALILGGGDADKPKLDGRTEKRRKRLIKELKDGRGGKALKPIDVVLHTNELLGIGETLASIKKQGVKPLKVEPTPEILDNISRAQKAYEFRTDAWKMWSLSVDAEGNVGVKTRAPRAAAAAPKKAAKKRAKKG
ncbi:MAG: hypothetical protein H6721_23610 [Sandaracinus sp.]|nr:hypothetical protein [Sandaracinus sp.]MCB9635123.1 hypothetical protein [Sandaracinus sp.]